MKTQVKTSVNYKSVINTIKASREVSKTLPGCRASLLAKYNEISNSATYQALTESEKSEIEQIIKVLKLSIKDSVIYKELLDTTRKTKSGAYCEFYLLQAVYKQF